MNCQEALDLLYDYIDKEASEIDTQAIREHLDNCPECFKRYELEESVNELLRERVNNCSPTPEVDNLRNRILSQLDEIDNQPPTDSGSRNIRFFSLGLVAAAALVILVGAAFFGSSLIRHQANYYTIEKAHSAIVGQVSPASHGSWQETVDELRQSLHYDIKPAVANYSLAAGFPDTIEDVPARHFVYRNNGSTVSVFVMPAEKFEIPSDLKETVVMRGDLKMFDHHCRGCRLVYHRTGDVVVVTATNDDTVELLDFIPGHVSM